MQVERIVDYIKQGNTEALRRENCFLVQAKGREVLRLYDPTVNYPEKLAQPLSRENGDWLLYVAVAHGDVDLFHHLCEQWYDGVLVTSLLLPVAVWHERLEIVYYLLARMQKQTLPRQDILQNTYLALTCAVIKGNKSVLAALCQADVCARYDRLKVIILVVDSYRGLVPTLLANGSSNFLEGTATLAHALGDQAMFLATVTNSRVNEQVPKTYYYPSCGNTSARYSFKLAFALA